MVRKHPLADVHEEIVVASRNRIKRADFMDAFGNQNTSRFPSRIHSHSFTDEMFFN